MPLFRDGKTPTFFVLVFRKDLEREASKKLQTYLNNLKLLGIKTDLDDFSVLSPDMAFLKVHFPPRTLLKFATIFDIDLDYKTMEYRPKVQPPFVLFSNILTRPDENDPVFARAPESVMGSIPTKVTPAERILLVNQTLSRVRFGASAEEYGLRRLIKEEVLLDAFPLHDGDYKWTDSGPLNDRQLLARYWGCAAAWYKAQPLNLIEKYYGKEFALYFAWLGFYIKMLIPAAIASVIVVIFGLATMNTRLNRLANDVCHSKMLMCPKCHFKKCKPELLKASCLHAYVSYLLDNPLTIAFAICMAIWSTVFMECFQRTESVLELQWNFSRLENDRVMRPQFVEEANRWKYSSATGEAVPYMTKRQVCYRYTATIVSIALLLLVMVTAMILIMVYRVFVILALSEKENENIFTQQKELVASFTGATMTAAFIYLFQALYGNLAIKLTNLENHRTSCAHKNAYIYKCYALAFVNNYATVFYIAFFKGRFYTHPGDIGLWHKLGGIGSDMCNYTGCTVDLGILLIMIMTVKCLTSNIIQVLVPKLEKFFKSKLRGFDSAMLKDYENEYLLPPTEEFFIVGEYMDMVIQYGFVTFFVVSFPLAPFFALLNNLSELRVDASKITKSYRRPIPSRVVGLGAWFGILQAMTYIGVVVNALVIAFTSNFMVLETYKLATPNVLQYDFINFTLSEFAVDDFLVVPPEAKPESEIVKAANFCFYHGQRYPPHHRLQYIHTTDYWRSTAFKFGMVVVFEHALILLKGLLAYAIPDVPFSVREQMNNQRRTEKKNKNKVLMAEYINTMGATKEQQVNI